MEKHAEKIRIAAAVALCLLVGLGVAGCKKKAPATAPDLVTDETVSAPRPDTAPPGDAVADAADPWGWDLDEINRRLHAEGLLADVYFDYDRAELSPESRARLEANARFLRENPQFVVAIEGHCDERGTIDYNLALGQQRAGGSQQYVELLGVPGNQLRSMSFGKERPQCSDPNESCWSRNRRAHFVVVERTGRS